MNSIPLTHQQAADPRLRSRLEAQGFAIIADTTNSTYHAVRVFSAETFAAETLSQSAESKPTEVKVVQERREKFNTIFVGGIMVGILATVFGNVISEFVLDDLRQAHRKFGYETSWWERMKSLKFWKLGE